MTSITVSEEDFEFLRQRATDTDCSVEEFIEQMILRERVLAKAPRVVLDSPAPNLEPPHRKWGM